MMEHIASGLLIFYPMYKDIREQKIDMRAAGIFFLLGLILKTALGEAAVLHLFLGALPGLSSFILSYCFKNFMGRGDSFLILFVGILEGMNFCIRLLMVAGLCICIFSVLFLALGRLTRKSRVACVPFLALGYIGAWLL